MANGKEQKGVLYYAHYRNISLGQRNNLLA